jgi:hypothetical protein
MECYTNTLEKIEVDDESMDRVYMDEFNEKRKRKVIQFS